MRHVPRRQDKRFQGLSAGLVRATSALGFLLGSIVVIPLTLWFAWAHQATVANSVLITLFCLAFGWGLVSQVLLYQRLQKLGLDGEGKLRLFSGPRPENPDELRAWLTGWHFMLAAVAALLCLIAIPVASWLSGKSR
jgi:hypothetical protein